MTIEDDTAAPSLDPAPPILNLPFYSCYNLGSSHTAAFGTSFALRFHAPVAVVNLTKDMGLPAITEGKRLQGIYFTYMIYVC